MSKSHTRYLSNLSVQVRARDIFLALKSSFGGNKISPAWSGEGTKRLTALTLVTFSLLILRLHIMGSKLPVFTRYDVAYII